METLTYTQVEQTILQYPESNFLQFKHTADNCLKSFTDSNSIIQLIDSEEFKTIHFHNLLHTLFHQVYMGSSSFAWGG